MSYGATAKVVAGVMLAKFKRDREGFVTMSEATWSGTSGM
jgi:hypothetical protein